MEALIAMSGGVDSSVAAFLAATTYGPKNCWGVHMLLNQEQESCDLKSRSCCGTRDAEDARQVAQQLGIMFDAIPMYKRFQEAVIDNFISEYAAGRTPIPCTHCNGVLKFQLLVDYADSVGAKKVITGHYVKKHQGRLWMDPENRKDQSYFLWPIKAEVLERLEFPVGTLDKEATRALAEDAGLRVFNKPDSQDICFVPAGNYRKVLAEKRPDLFSPTKGQVIHQGQPIGTHDGYWNFTIGQRLRLPGLSHRLYVTGIDPHNNRVIAGEALETMRKSFVIKDCNWHDTKPVHAWVKTSAHSQPVECTVLGARCFVATPVRATPGQAAVFYSKHPEGFRLEGGGWIR